MRPLQCRTQWLENILNSSIDGHQRKRIIKHSKKSASLWYLSRLMSTFTVNLNMYKWELRNFSKSSRRNKLLKWTSLRHTWCLKTMPIFLPLRIRQLLQIISNQFWNICKNLSVHTKDILNSRKSVNIFKNSN